MTTAHAQRLIRLVKKNAAQNVQAPTKAKRMQLLVRAKIYTPDGKLTKHYR